MSVASGRFQVGIDECKEAVTVFQHLQKDGYVSAFGLRFVWIAAVSALDHFISELIVEKAVASFDIGTAPQPKLITEKVTFGDVLLMQDRNPVDALVHFRKVLRQTIKYRSFQSADSISDGLSFVWAEKHRWRILSQLMGRSEPDVRATLNNIVDRRNLIAHNADYNDSSGSRMLATETDAIDVIAFVEDLVAAIQLSLEA